MERPLPFQPADRSPYPPGWMLSAGLHLGLLLAAFWYMTARPILPPMLPVLPVDLVMLSPVTRPQQTLTPPGRSAPRPAVAAANAGTRPDGITPPEDELGDKLQALSQLRAPNGPLNLGAGEGTGNGGLSLRDFIRAQIMRRWIPDISRGQRRDRAVLLRVTVNAAGVITDVVILDRQQFDGDLLFRNMAIGARNAAILTSPVRMPPGNWPASSTVDIALDPRAASR
ncbi:MAG TPA: hypothetical protein VJ798_09145 [Rhizomicrobium sp.]|nr:hypothetical protein [Rhizomicrobium sp.]